MNFLSQVTKFFSSRAERGEREEIGFIYIQPAIIILLLYMYLKIKLFRTTVFYYITIFILFTMFRASFLQCTTQTLEGKVKELRTVTKKRPGLSVAGTERATPRAFPRPRTRLYRSQLMIPKPSIGSRRKGVPDWY